MTRPARTAGTVAARLKQQSRRAQAPTGRRAGESQVLGARPEGAWRTPRGRATASLGACGRPAGSGDTRRARRGITVAEKFLELEVTAALCLTGAPFCFSVGGSRETGFVSTVASARSLRAHLERTEAWLVPPLPVQTGQMPRAGPGTGPESSACAKAGRAVCVWGGGGHVGARPRLLGHVGGQALKSLFQGLVRVSTLWRTESRNFTHDCRPESGLPSGLHGLHGLHGPKPTSLVQLGWRKGHHASRSCPNTMPAGRPACHSADSPVHKGAGGRHLAPPRPPPAW